MKVSRGMSSRELMGHTSALRHFAQGPGCKPVEIEVEYASGSQAPYAMVQIRAGRRQSGAQGGTNHRAVACAPEMPLEYFERRPVVLGCCCTVCGLVQCGGIVGSGATRLVPQSLDEVVLEFRPRWQAGGSTESRAYPYDELVGLFRDDGPEFAIGALRCIEGHGVGPFTIAQKSLRLAAVGSLANRARQSAITVPEIPCLCANNAQPICERYERTMLSFSGLGRQMALGSPASDTRSSLETESKTLTSSPVDDPSLSRVQRRPECAGRPQVRTTRPTDTSQTLRGFRLSLPQVRIVSRQRRPVTGAHAVLGPVADVPISSTRSVRIAATTSRTASTVRGKLHRIMSMWTGTGGNRRRRSP